MALARTGPTGLMPRLDERVLDTTQCVIGNMDAVCWGRIEWRMALAGRGPIATVLVLGYVSGF